MSDTLIGSLANYPDRGDNCVVCDSTLEPTAFICTFCDCAARHSALVAEEYDL